MPIEDNEHEASVVEETSTAAQPMTEAERLKKKQEDLLAESEEQRATRRNGEEARLVAGHDSNIQLAREQYPVPDGVPFEELTPAEKVAWNQRRTSIDQANRAYHLAVKRLMAERTNENAFLAQQRATVQS